MLAERPRWWPHFSSTLRSTAVTSRLGRVLGIAIAILLATGLLSHYQYAPWHWLPTPASPRWGYRVTQGVHIAVGTATIPLLLVKLWSIYPNLFRFPPVKSILHGLERASVAVLISSSLVQVTTGFLNVLNWYPFPWYFTNVHRFLGYVVAGSVLLHVGLKLNDIRYGLQAKVPEADVLTETPWDENPDSHSNAGTLADPPTPAISRRGVLLSAGTGVGIVVATSVGQTATFLEPIGLLAPRQWTKGPQSVPVNRTADQAAVRADATAADWALTVDGPTPYRLTLAEVEAMVNQNARIPVNCVEGWSAGADWRGMSLLDVVLRAGGSADSTVTLHSLEKEGGFNHSIVVGPQVSAALLATHLNGQRLDVDHGYPLRLIAPNRAGVLNTKWLTRIEVTR